jgi:uncharacterized membrane protein
MGLFHIVVIVAALLCSLVAGFLFAFAVVAMPGLRQLDDREFIRAFQAIDRVIQENQLSFMLVWVGSVPALVLASILGIVHLDGTGRLLLIVATLAYLVGVQLPTVGVNLPLNNRLQAVDVDTVNEDAHRTARAEFEPRWNRWNAVRTAVATVVSALLLVLLSQI